MGIRESLLNTITSVGNGDFIRIVTSAGASSKATLANVFKSFESGLGAKSSLTNSDYVRVVGTDNASYKQLVSDVAKKIIENYTGSSLAGSSQSVKSALDALNSNTSVTVPVTLSGITANAVARKRGNIVHCYIELGNGTTFADATGNNAIATLPLGYRPPADIQSTALVRDNGTWASANYSVVALHVLSDGAVQLRGNANAIKNAKYVTGSIVFSV